MGLSGFVPVLHRLVMFSHRPEALVTTGYELVMRAFYVCAMAYAATVPEQWMPGKFDLDGHSHQLFHVLVIAGAYTHYFGGLVYLRWRERWKGVSGSFTRAIKVLAECFYVRTKLVRFKSCHANQC